MLYDVTVVSAWTTVNGERHPAVTLDYPTPYGWGDITDQPDANIPPDPNLCTLRGRITDVQLDALSLNADYLVLISEEVV